ASSVSPYLLRSPRGHMLFPYTPLFRSAVDDRGVVERVGDDRVLLAQQRLEQPAVGVEAGGVEDRVLGAEETGDGLLELLVQVLRSEEHTSELQSRENLVCRLLLEKKKI